MTVMNDIQEKLLAEFVKQFGTDNWSKLTPEQKARLQLATSNLTALSLRMMAGEDVEKEIQIVKATLANLAITASINITSSLFNIMTNLLNAATGILVTHI